MFFKLEHNKNYAHLFFIIAALTVLSIPISRGKLTGLVFSLSFYYLGIAQLYSGVALSQTWTAKYKREDNPILFWMTVILSFVMGTYILTMFFSTKI